MLYFLFILLAGAVCLNRIRRMYVQTRVRSHQFRLYALRDQLRQFAMNGRVSSRNWVFLYLDSSIAKAISVLDQLTIWNVIAINLVNREDKRFEVAHNQLQLELSKPKNVLLKDIYNNYIINLGLFAADRHPTIKVFLIKVFEAAEAARSIQKRSENFIMRLTKVPKSFALAAVRSIRKRYDHLIMRIAEVPETSTLQEHVPATA